MAQLTILGLGLIGGSLGLALKKGKIEKGWEIVGHDRDPETAGRAKKKGAVDRIEWNLHRAVNGADIVVIAVPVLAVREIFTDIAEDLKADCIVTDMSSTKVDVMKWADELLPVTVSFIGGHPMAGKELPGIDAADGDLFNGATYCLCPSVRAEERASEQMIGLAEAIGATPYVIDPHEHDGLVAGISHLPVVVAAALVAATTEAKSWREMSKLAASGFRDTTRLASGDPTMNLHIFETNRGQVVSWIDRYIEELQRFRTLVAEGGEPLAKELLEVQTKRDHWLYGDKSQPGQFDDIRKSMSITSMMMGERLTNITRSLGGNKKKP